ncbi:MAG: TetR/AcrR family transcriptional regulator [Actinomycetota bacterium]|nr:TetR/AcrR family transcriptional regulator [Actinomycetota bacterium]
MESKRTQASRTAATRSALVSAARPLFTRRGFADVGTDELARAAGVTRGALYHQFGGKEELFAAVFEEVEADLTEAIGHRLAQADESDPVGLMRAGVDAWLDSCANPEVTRIVLIEAPAVLGWSRWREIGRRYGVGLIESAVTGAMAAGAIIEQPALPLAHVLSGALEEAALYAVRADDLGRATEQVRRVLMLLLEGLIPADCR